MNDKKIAIFIPCYNAARTIGQTLSSVEQAIAHFGAKVPVYIYDDCSKDGSPELAARLWHGGDNLVVRRNQTNSGERTTTNDAFRYFLDRYQWVLIIHADDIVKPAWITELHRQIALADDQACFTIWSSFDALDDGTGKVTPGHDTGEVTILERTEAEKKQFIVRLYGSWHISGAAINVGLFRKLEGFDPTMPQFGDTDFYARGLLAGYKDVYVGKTLTYYRVLENSVSSTSVKTNRDIREGLYLLNKFSSLLDAKELRLICGNIIRLASGRAIRQLKKQDIRNFFYCTGVATRLSLKYLRSLFFL